MVVLDEQERRTLVKLLQDNEHAIGYLNQYSGIIADKYRALLKKMARATPRRDGTPVLID